MTIIDAHQHVWDPGRARYDWLSDELAPINRAFGFDELRPALRRAGVQATVLVQSADNHEDTELMLASAAANQEVAAVVAWVPLERPYEAAERLTQLRRSSLVVGVRSLIHENPDPDWVLRRDVDEGLGVLEAAGVTFDFVSVLPRHLEHVPTLAARHPRLKIVIDHLSNPPIGLGSRDPWWALIERAAESPLVHAKVSGLYSASSDSAARSTELISPFFEHAVQIFGPDRLMYGGDWPICVLSGGYDAAWERLSALFDGLDAGDRHKILGGTAEKFYSISSDRLAAARVASQRP
jgi:L-fuconolactonase